MPIFWGNRNRDNRHRRHNHQSHAGTRVINARDGGRGRSVVAVPNNISTSYVNTNDGGRYRSGSRRRPSTLHGLWTKFLGVLTGSRARRRRGDREMRRAREERNASRIARQVGRVRGMGPMNKLRKFHNRHRHHNRSRRPADPVVIAQDTRHGRTPWGHYSGRAPPPYQGAHHRLLGFLTGRRDRVVRGEALAIAADEERRRERRRRREEMTAHGRRYRARGSY